MEDVPKTVHAATETNGDSTPDQPSDELFVSDEEAHGIVGKDEGMILHIVGTYVW